MSEPVWIVQWAVDPMPHDQWHRDRFWPFVEVYETWADAWRKLGTLTDAGYPATFRELSVHPASVEPYAAAIREHVERIVAETDTPVELLEAHPTSAEAIGAAPWWETAEPGDPVEVYPATLNGVSGFVLWPGVPGVPVVQFCGCGHSRPGHVDLDGACTACACDRFTPRG